MKREDVSLLLYKVFDVFEFFYVYLKEVIVGFFRGGDGGVKEYILLVSKLKLLKLRFIVYEIKK